MFDANAEVERITGFIKEFFAKRPGFKGAVIGMSGGKDSLVCAALCKRALHKNKVYGVLMPNGNQPDVDDAYAAVKFLEIDSMTINLLTPYKTLLRAGETRDYRFPPDVCRNVLPRMRMTMLYAIAQHRRSLVCCTSNLSETTIGYTTKWGDNVGDFAPIAHLTKTEVVAVGIALGLPHELVIKTPADGMSGLTDEQNFKFSYTELDDYIRNNREAVPSEVVELIEARIAANSHKRPPIPSL